MSSNIQHEQGNSQRSGKGNFASDSQKASEAGKKSGANSHMNDDKKGSQGETTETGRKAGQQSQK